MSRRCKDLGIDDTKIAKFVKAYHEIRFNGAQSSYIPNFDTYTLEQKYALISQETGVSLEELETRSIEITEVDFRSIVAKEVTDLEHDVLNAMS